MKLRSFLTLPALAAMTAPALAHPGHGAEVDTLFVGLMHPLSGADHVLAMVAVGLWAALLGGRALWLVPTSFVLSMVGGFLLGMNGMMMPAVEPGIAASIIVLGVLIASAMRLSLLPSMMIVGLFGLFHGNAHGAELTGTATMFGLGFISSTILLHLMGIALGRVLGGKSLLLARALGGLIAASGLLILGGVA